MTYSKFPFRCSASQQDYYSYSTLGAPKSAANTPARPYVICPECGRAVKLRAYRQGAVRRVIPTHNKEKLS